MHVETFLPAFLLFAVLGLVLPVALAGISMKGRTIED